MRRLVRTVRISAPMIVPEYPPRPPMIDVPPMTAAATDGSTDCLDERQAGRLDEAGDEDAGDARPAAPR